MTPGSFELTSSSLPASELAYLVTVAGRDIPDGAVEQVPGESDRSVAITTVAAVAAVVVPLLAPFLQALAHRLFEREPAATLEVRSPDGSHTVSLTVDLSAEDRERLIAEALARGARTATIDLP